MNDTPPSTPLTDQALLRLRKLAEGNGLAPESIALVGTEEKIYELEGTLTLTPKTDVQQGRYPGPPQVKDRRILPDAVALKNEVENRRRQFMQGRDWVEKALEELKAHEGHGWGLDGAHVTMPERTVVLAASTACPACHGQRLVTCATCHGQGLITCMQCQGTRRERCYTCGGTGANPQNPNEQCLMCHGQRFVICRRCQGRGQMTCPTCQGRRGTPCPACKGTGQITEEAGIAFSAETHFTLKSQGLPSGLRRGLDRLGIPNLAKGHADIEIVPPKKEDGDDRTPPRPGEEKPQDAKPPELHYRALLPYADIKIRFGADARAVMIAAFGKRAALLDVPPFLDEALKPAREILKQATVKGAALEGALHARAVREALELELGGRGIKEFRRLYSVGISQAVAGEIFANLRRAAKAYTLRLRGMVAVAGAAASAGIFALVFLTGINAALTRNMPAAASFLLDLALPGFVLGLNVLALGAASRLSLQRRFPDTKIALRMRLGKTGYGLLAAVIFIYIAVIFLAPVKPAWVFALLSRL